MAWRVHPKISIGLGIDYGMFDGTLESRVDFGALAGQPEFPPLDGSAVLSGDGADWTANIGLLVSPIQGLDIGMSYLSGVSMTATGSRDISVPPQLQSGLGFPPTISYTRQELVLRMPQIWRVGLAWQATPNWLVVAEAQILDRGKERFVLRNQGPTATAVLPDGEGDLIPVPFSTERSY